MQNCLMNNVVNNNRNEKCLLSFLSCTDFKKDLLETVTHYGSYLKFEGTNTIYNIIDELTYCEYIKNAG